MRFALRLLPVILAGACASFSARPEQTAPARTAPPSGPVADPSVILPEEDGGPPKPDDPEARKRHMTERFPGVKELDLVKVTAWAEPGSGVCWSQLTPPQRASISVDYSEGWRRARHRLSGLEALAAAGWTRVYRAPRGEGVERRTRFRDLDLTYETDLACLCAPGSEAVAGDRQRLTLRLRWEEGKVPEIGATSTHDGRRRGLIGSLTVGRVAIYDFTVGGAFPEGGSGSCAAHFTVALVIEPPVL
jgi:hypothetical protein